MLKRCQKFSSNSIKDTPKLTNSTLKLIHVVFRHGNRTPALHKLRNDPISETGYKPYGPGQLTNKGKERMYKLGQYIRRQYDDFLGDYFPGVVQARTTCVDRTQCSLQLFLAGLYPPKEKLIWEPSLLWQPIPYITTNIENDSILQAFTHDPQFEIAYSKYKQARYEIPEWTKKIFPKPLEQVAALHYVHTCATPQLRTYVLKPFTDKVIHDTELMIKEESKVLIYIYSGHEVNVAHTLIALNSFQPTHIPDYGSCVVLEVHMVNGKAYIKGFYKPTANFTTQQLQLWNKNPIEFQEFVENISKNYK